MKFKNKSVKEKVIQKIYWSNKNLRKVISNYYITSIGIKK